MRKRIPTALILIVLVFCIIQFLSGLAFFLILQAIILVSLFEFYHISRKKNLSPKGILGAIISLTISFSFFFDDFSLTLALFACFVLISLYFLISTNRIEKLTNYHSSLTVTFFGAIYLSLTLSFFYLIKQEKGPFYIYFLLVVIIIGDTGAYLIGKFFGRHKMFPIASPKKTWEGSMGGILFATLIAFLAQKLILTDVLLWKAVVCGVFIHGIAQISDPFESLFKRAVGVKDSSRILPGHGGILDRLDSYILATPFYYYIIKFFWS
ncbi:MAG: phosphatidate cytidylyltransferase [Candidatus Aminicenantaceae bacterium]